MTGAIFFSLMKTSLYFLLVSCEASACSLWKTSGGRKGEGSSASSDNGLLRPLTLGLEDLWSVATGAPPAGTVTAVKQRPRTQAKDTMRWHCAAGHSWLVTPGSNLAVTDQCVYRRDASDWRRTYSPVSAVWEAGTTAVWWGSGRPGEPEEKAEADRSGGSVLFPTNDLARSRHCSARVNIRSTSTDTISFSTEDRKTHITREMGLISLLYTGHHMAWESWLNYTNGWLVQGLIRMINSVGTRGLLSSNPWLVRVTNPLSPTRSHSGATLMACR